VGSGGPAPDPEAALGRSISGSTNAMGSVFSPVKEDDACGIRRGLKWIICGCVYGALACVDDNGMFAPPSRGDCANRAGAGVLRGIRCRRVLRGQACEQGFLAIQLRCELLHDKSKCAPDDGAMPRSKHRRKSVG